MKNFKILFLIILLLPIFLFPMELTVKAGLENFNITTLGGGIRSFNGILGLDLSVLKDLTNGFYFEGSLFLVIPAGDILPYGGLTKKFDLSNTANIFNLSTDLYGTIGLEVKLSNIGVFGEVLYDINAPISITNPSKISVGIAFDF